MVANKFHKDNTLLPQNTKNKIGNLEDIDNFALKLNKCVNWFEKDKFNSGVPIIEKAKVGTAKLDALKYKKDKSTNEEFRINADFSKVKMNDILVANRNNADALCIQTKKVSDLISNWHMIIGLGNESVYETSMTLHHVYGIPYIPASGIKGLLHNWALNESEDKNTIEEIFGTEDKAGKVIFFDAFPIYLQNDSIQPDIMNPHYPDYYDGEKPPADWQSPRPIFFLTLKKTNFEFIFGIKDSNYVGLLETLTKSETGWLYRALKEQGIGAKTAVGYGRMYEEEKVKPEYYGDKKLKVGEIIDGEVIKEGNKQNIRLFYQENIDNPIVNVAYGIGFTKDDIGKIVTLRIKSLHGNKQKPKINLDGFGDIKFKT